MAESTTLELSNSTTTSDVLILEQEEWSDNIGKYTKLDLIDQISSTFFDTDAPDPRCAVEEGVFVTGVYVYPYDPSLTYNIFTSWGALGDVVISEVTVIEAVNFSLSTEETLKYPVNSVTSYEWYEGMWDKEGNPATAPEVAISGNKVSVDSKIYGSLKVEYVTVRHARQLQVSAREDVVENFYSSSVITQWDGGCKLLEIDAPPNAEDDYFNGVSCGNRSIFTINPSDPSEKTPPTAEREVKEVSIDYCTQTPLI